MPAVFLLVCIPYLVADISVVIERHTLRSAILTSAEHEEHLLHGRRMIFGHKGIWATFFQQPSIPHEAYLKEVDSCIITISYH